MNPKLYKVECRTLPEWGEDTLDWTKYFLANTYETVEAYVVRHFGFEGSLRHYFSYDRCEQVISIEEVKEFQVL